MSESKLTVRVPREMTARAKAYARRHDTTLTRPTLYLEQVGETNEGPADAPIVRRLMGSLPADLGVEDYHAYPEAKYGQTTEGAS